MNTKEIFHLWANQAKPSGKSGNVRFDGVDLYSYGACIATMINGVVVLSDRSYSMTTARHQSKARQALTYEQMNKHVQVPEIGSRNVAELAKLCKVAVEDNITNIIIEDALIGRYRNARVLEPRTYGIILTKDF